MKSSAEWVKDVKRLPDHNYDEDLDTVICWIQADALAFARSLSHISDSKEALEAKLAEGVADLIG